MSFDVKVSRQGFEKASTEPRYSTGILEAEPGKLDTKIREPGIQFFTGEIQYDLIMDVINKVQCHVDLIKITAFIRSTCNKAVILRKR